MVSYNIGQLAYLNALRYGIKRIFFGGFFIRGHPYTMDTISYAIRFWSKVRRSYCEFLDGLRAQQELVGCHKMWRSVAHCLPTHVHTNPNPNASSQLWDRCPSPHPSFLPAVAALLLPS
jgi:hypothetical protein